MSSTKRIPGILYLFLKPWFLRRGFGSIGARRVADMFYEDLVGYSGASFGQKLWAYRRGFLSERIERYGLNESNTGDFLPDANYYKLKAHLNSPLGNWYDNKLTTRFLLRRFDRYMEDAYFFVKEGQFIPLMDRPVGLAASAQGISDHVKHVGPLAAKAIKGSLGAGFIRLAYENGTYLADRTPMDEAAFIRRVGGLNGYVIVRYLQCHRELRRIHDRAANALRVVTGYDPDLGRAEVVAAHMRFATDRSGYLEHVIHGGVLAGVDIKDGRMYRPLAHNGERYVDIEVHPDTGVAIAGHVPHWELIVSKVCEISNELPVTPHLTYDIVVTDEGFRILEINSHSDISNLQIYYPFLKNEVLRKLFSKVIDNPQRTK